MYYLQSRYYDSNTGRFINADGLISTGTGLLGYNMYAYCNNNPIIYVDSCGTEPDLNQNFDNPAAILGYLIGYYLFNWNIKEKEDATAQQIEDAKNFADSVEVKPRDNETVDINFDTKEFIDNVDVAARDYFYEYLYERSLNEAQSKNIDVDNLMSFEHIKWETGVHLAGYGIFPNCNVTNLNVEENIFTLGVKVVKAIFGIEG